MTSDIFLFMMHTFLRKPYFIFTGTLKKFLVRLQMSFYKWTLFEYCYWKQIDDTQLWFVIYFYVFSLLLRLFQQKKIILISGNQEVSFRRLFLYINSYTEIFFPLMLQTLLSKIDTQYFFLYSYTFFKTLTV